MGSQPLFEVGAPLMALASDEWYTPRWLFKIAGLTFDLDVCAPMAPEFRTCPARRYLTVAEDGLISPWEGLVWMNPPYSNPAPWVRRWAAHADGVALMPSSDGIWWGPMLAAAESLTILARVKFTSNTGRPARPVSRAAILLGRGTGKEFVRRLAVDRYGIEAMICRDRLRGTDYE